jgi:hypothetical protein
MSGLSHQLDQIMRSSARATLTQADLANLIDTVSGAMRDAYVLTGGMALLALLLALTYPMKLGPANQTHLN